MRKATRVVEQHQAPAAAVRRADLGRGSTELVDVGPATTAQRTLTPSLRRMFEQPRADYETSING